MIPPYESFVNEAANPATSIGRSLDDQLLDAGRKHIEWIAETLRSLDCSKVTVKGGATLGGLSGIDFRQVQISFSFGGTNYTGTLSGNGRTIEAAWSVYNVRSIDLAAMLRKLANQ